MAWYVAYSIVHLIFLVDLYLDRAKRTTISLYVHRGPVPNWLFYAVSVIALNALFWFVSPASAALALGFWLLGHFSK